MTAYGDRRRAGYYQLGTVKTKVQNTVSAPGGGTTNQPAQAPPEPTLEINPDETTLAELQAQAEALGLPTYGSKPMLAARIANAKDIQT